MGKGLTKRQQELLAYLKEVHENTGLMPSTREIQEFFGFSSQTAAMGHLRALEKKGFIIRIPGKARAIMFADQTEASDRMADAAMQKAQANPMTLKSVSASDGTVKIPLYGDCLLYTSPSPRDA